MYSFYLFLFEELGKNVWLFHQNKDPGHQNFQENRIAVLCYHGTDYRFY